MIDHPCYSIIHKSFFPIFPSSVPQVQNKCRKIIQNENIKYICDLFPFVIFKRDFPTWMFTEQRSRFFILIGDTFFSIIILCCIFLFQKAAINNTLISKECLRFYVVK